MVGLDGTAPLGAIPLFVGEIPAALSEVKMPNVPIALIRRLCYPSTYRLPKLPRLQYPRPKTAQPIACSMTILGGNNRLLNSRLGLPVTGPFPEKRGNLPNDEYRFWVGRIYPENTSAQCRWCEKHVNGANMRKDHHKAGDCRENLTLVYRMLRKDTKCVVCDQQHAPEKWGVPMCDACQSDWKYSLPGGFKYAVLLLKTQIERKAANA